MIWMWSVVAMAGYGDPVSGLPSPEARAMHVWTNAVRVDPEAFQTDYLAGGCDDYLGHPSPSPSPSPMRGSTDVDEIDLIAGLEGPRGFVARSRAPLRWARAPLRWARAREEPVGAARYELLGCNEYYVRATYSGVEVRYPETGSYGWGGCAWDDVDAQWMARQLAPVPPPSLVSDPWTVGASVDLTATGVVAGSTVHLVLGTQEGTGPCPPALGGLCVGVDGLVRHLGPVTAAAGHRRHRRRLRLVGHRGRGRSLSPIRG